MSNEQDDAVFVRNFSVVLAGLTIIGLICFILAKIVNANFADTQDGDRSATKRIAPVGSVNVGEPMVMTQAGMGGAAAKDSEPAVAMSDDPGENTYGKICMSCHDAGIAGAPKIGDKSAWGPRLEKGTEMLVMNAINGIQGESGMMPARGGLPSLSDDEVRGAVMFMLGKLDVAEAAPAATSTVVETEAQPEASTSPEPKVEAQPEVMPATAEAAPVTAEPATESMTEAQPEAAPATAEAAPVAADPATESMTEAQPETATAEAAPAEPAVEAEPATEETPDTALAVADGRGKEVYDAACFICHASGVSGAPKFGDAEWQVRAAKGMEVLYGSAINGFMGENGFMPPKGGRPDFSDDDVKAAVDFMANSSK